MAGQVVDVEKYKYDRIKVRGPDGVARYTAGNKDAIAKAMFGMTKEQIRTVATENNLDLAVHFEKRNMGHLRMIVGQALRNIIAKKGTVLIDGHKITKLNQKASWPKGYVEEPKGTTQHPIRKKSK